RQQEPEAETHRHPGQNSDRELHSPSPFGRDYNFSAVEGVTGGNIGRNRIPTVGRKPRASGSACSSVPRGTRDRAETGKNAAITRRCREGVRPAGRRSRDRVGTSRRTASSTGARFCRALPILGKSLSTARGPTRGGTRERQGVTSGWRATGSTR